MAIHDQNGVDRSQSGLAVENGVSLSAGPHSGARIQVNDEFSCWNDYAPKARKPYTITKQRERWTDEEHKKFLEALKLYGRAWRKIEEHVGSKTAVQIRSHAQKFFSKVLRDPNGSSTTSMESIEIPPPRPKRKPMHPYPRKLVELPVKGNSNPEHLMRSNSLKSSDSDQENQSPKSVLSSFGSDTQGSTDLETQNGSSSPISALTGANTSGFSLAEPKNLSKEDRFPSLPSLNADTALDEQPLMKFKFFPKENVSTKDVEESSGRTLKLFGATLMVNETCQPSTPTMATCKTGQESDRTLPWSHMPQGLQGPKYLMQHKSGKSNVAQGVGAFVPWSLSHIESFAPSQKEEPGRENLESNLEEIENKFLEKEVSWSGSNSSTINDYENSEKSETEGFVLSKRSIAASERLALSVKGFVPYKRGIAEIENQSSTIEEREEQRIRLSL